MHFASIAKVAGLAHTRSHEPVEKNEEASQSVKSLEPHKIVKITTLEEFDQVLEDHHHHRLVVFCVTTTYKDPDVDEEGWFHHYEKLNNVHFVRVDTDVSPPIEERLQPKTKPCWYTFHKGQMSGWSSGGMKRFLQVHNERRNSY